MQKYIALLRGINVGGHKKIKMADLKAFLMELEFQNSQTYIQSGNIIFDFPASNHTDLEVKIKTIITKKYGFEVPVVIRTAEELVKIRDANPFFDASVDITKLFVVFLSQNPTEQNIEKLNQYCIDKNSEDIFEIQNKEIHVKYSIKGYGRSKLNNNLFERVLKVQATTRNWKTLNKLIELSKNT